MARKKNASFVGSPTVDVARDSSIFARWVANAAGDLALVYDKITGENGHSATDTINHSGSGRGCPLALPIGSQQINRNLRIVGAVNQADFYILVFPVFVAAGTQRYVLEVDTTQYDDDQITAEVRSTAWAIVDDPQIGTREPPGRGGLTVRFFLTLGAGWQYVAVKKYLRHDDVDPNGYLHSWRMWPEWLAPGSSNGLTVAGSGAAGNPYASMSSITPAIMASETIDSDMVKDNSPLDAWVLTRLNRQLGALWEHLTGAPIPGAETATCATLRNHDRVVFPAEPLIEFPMMSLALSCMKVDNVTIKSDFVGTMATTAPIEGPIDWVRYPQTTVAGTVVAVSRTYVYFPSFRDFAGGSALAGRVLILDYSTAGIGGNWQARFTIDGNVSAWVSFSAIAGTNLYQATFTGLLFSADAACETVLEIRNNTAGAIGGQEIIVLGYGLAFTP